MRFIKATCVAALLVVGSASADDKSPAPPKMDKDKAKLTDADKAIVDHEHAVNQTEIQMGKLAQSKGATAGVKDFGKSLVNDHQMADDALASFAKKHDITIGKDKPTGDADKMQMKDDEAAMAKLGALKGADFDREFLQMTVVAHDRELAKLDSYLAVVSDADLKAVLTGLKPVMQKHADTARELQKNAPTASK